MRYYELIPHTQNGVKGDFIKEYHLKDKIDDNKFLGNYSNGKKLRILPLIPSIELGSCYKIPDLFDAGGSISPRFVMSNLLKEILDNYGANKKIQFFPIELIQNGNHFNNFWVTNFYDGDDHWIDFGKSEFIEQIISREGNPYIGLKFSSKKNKKKYENLQEFLDRAGELYDTDNKLFAIRIYIQESCKEDVMILDDCISLKIVVSDQLKRKIEVESLLGLEFKPLDISEEEWYGPNGLRTQYYK